MDMDVTGARVYTAALTGDQVLQNFNAGINNIITPEPSTLVLLATGLLSLLAYAWRKRK